jgi:hypothetical protein
MKNHWLKINHVYVVDDGEKWWYVATSLADALDQHKAQIDDPNDLFGIVVTELSDDTWFGVRDEDDDSVIDVKTCKEWAANGRGCIGSTVW